jgi:hypothetical protein
VIIKLIIIKLLDFNDNIIEIVDDLSPVKLNNNGSISIDGNNNEVSLPRSDDHDLIDYEEALELKDRHQISGIITYNRWYYYYVIRLLLMIFLF